MKRQVLLLAGHVCVGLGLAGIVLPLMPATVFFLMAAACYVRSSERHYHRLMEHPVVGPLLRSYREKRAVPLWAKVAALAGLWASLLLTIFFLPYPPVRWGVAGIGVVLTVIILLIRTLKDSDT